ncbi:hypothetical protein BC936DRAFT_144355 [Jimgerdemannia flammicorona]|uniref:Uncharacterized protein n=1 Tax=Jimgerdemannia flammicorona TaxID=994334 RepID=A0A433DCL4_9FUNG|nr:hypothetical protein BC936DRAFT_144355 [Jimgerdemannia flammicorona]
MAPHAEKEPKERDEYLERAKCFYYSRFVQPIDYNELVAWRNKGSQVGGLAESESSQQQNRLEAITTSSDPRSSPVVSVDDSAKDNATATNPPAAGVKLSFDQLVEMINKGETIPGARSGDSEEDRMHTHVTKRTRIFSSPHPQIIPPQINSTPAILPYRFSTAPPVGIKQIPNKLNEGTPSVPSQARRPKPWEVKKEGDLMDVEESQLN